MQIGIPRALSYYNFYPFWYGFFSYLGIEIVLSDNTTKKTLSVGSSLVVPETCLPIKVYVGHILNLLDKGIDKIFVPSIQSIAPKIYNCSKIRGLPDLIRNVIKRDFTLIEATLDKSQKGQGLYEFLKEIVNPIGITDNERIKQATKHAWKVYNNFNVMVRSGISYKTALKNALEGKVVISNEIKTHPIKVALIAHGYNLYDDKISMKIFDKLQELDVNVCTAEQLTMEQMQEGLNKMQSKAYWANEYEISGAAAHYIQDASIDGIITINAFGCGPDSLMLEKVTRFSKEYNKPLLTLSIDEQTGEAGFITRIEAFTDMLFRKKRALITKNINIKDININKNISNSNSIKEKIS